MINSTISSKEKNFEEKFNQFKECFYKNQTLKCEKTSFKTPEKTMVTEMNTAINEEKNFYSLDSKIPPNKSKSKFFHSNQKTIRNFKILKKNKIKDKNELKWDSTVKIERKSKKEQPKSQKTNRNFIYLNVLQNCCKLNTSLKKTKEKNFVSEKNQTDLSDNKKETLPEMLDTEFYKDLNNKSIKDVIKSDKRCSISLNNLGIIENNHQISEDLKETSAKEIYLTSSSINEEKPIKLEEVVHDLNILNTKEKSLENDNITNLDALQKSELIIEQSEKFADSDKTHFNSLSFKPKDYSNLRAHSSSDLKEKLKKSFAKEIIKGTQNMEESLNTMFKNKLMLDERTKSRSELKKIKSDKGKNMKKNELKKLRKFMEDSSSITIVDYDLKNENNVNNNNNIQSDKSLNEKILKNNSNTQENPNF